MAKRINKPRASPAKGNNKSKSNSKQSPKTSKSSKTNKSSKNNPSSTPRRVRRQCSIPSCPNRVVQGGVCVTHGAKRKLCQEPGCDKAVKIAGCCSTHGPARRRCDYESCTRVAVQGGKCLSHGARRRVCAWTGDGGVDGACNKNAIVGGMCKKHHDLMEERGSLMEGLEMCVPIGGIDGTMVDKKLAMESIPSMDVDVPPPVATSNNNNNKIATAKKTMTDGKKPASKKKHPRHQRGLSIFDEMSTVDAIISSSAEKEQVLGEGEQQGQETTHDSEAMDTTTDYPVAPSSQSHPLPPPPASVSSSTISSLPPSISSMLPGGTKTPKPTVTFALGPASAAFNNAHHQSLSNNNNSNNEEYFSPTLAIFEQMIQASHVLDKEKSSTTCSKLSPPKLSPRYNRPPANESGGAASDVNDMIGCPVGQEEGAAVLRKVSSNNIVGQAPAAAAAAGNNYYHGDTANQDGHAPDPHGAHPPPPHYRHAPPPPPQHQYYQQHPQPPPHQHHHHHHHGAPAAIPSKDHLSRTVSHDVEDVNTNGTNANTILMSPHRRVAYYHPNNSHHHHAHHHHHYPVPETPALCDPSAMDPVVMVSAGSHGGSGREHLLPKRREQGALEHLFIP